ncbi:hypothetical protein FROZEN_84 [Erwinia phage vB_EamP_Frozen]|uniref:Uncharacterized protein n=3 Tax=Johnsonvirus frozen TaxID=1982578 RepID=A0A191ZD40_9CAUD|nr:hypothetical protein FROZEN_84 [Erwinia phage vB_EamP_Frozen]ANJ65205.1 hypothetical protein FROZEN_84 [Erwinia phage vB_EamP_Frozen]ANJ65304.1 hypothetical protein REXELLA_83 [Erwinia phage vB_EamP_Rexella]ANJ65380.1 hypothetical protein GUTMEISTER_76 [Erwinia phage vB_EamP_Gutmeister]
MSTLDESQANGAEENTVDEMSVLKSRAKAMGIEFSNSIGLDTLRNRINEKLAPAEAVEPQVNPLAMGEKPVTKKRTLRQKLHDEQMKLIRIRITCMDPKKANLPGEIFTVANEHLGTVKKFVPYGEATDEGFHVPYCIYRALEARKFLNIRSVKDRRTGVPRIESNWLKEFSIAVLPPLTVAQIADLKTAQIAAGSID